MKRSTILLVFACLGMLASCVFGGKQKEIDRLSAKLDSLQTVTRQQDSIQTEIDYYIETLASTLDSIRIQENILTLRVDENGKPLKKQQIKENLNHLSEVIQRQRERIEELENQMTSEGKTVAYYKKLVAHLREELDEKDAEIARMQQDLNKKDVTISRLNTRISSLEQDVEEISNRAKEQEQALSQQAQVLVAQSNMLNTGYVKIATKKELNQAGFLKKGLFSGGQLNVDGLDTSSFVQVDIRDFREISLSSYKPKLLTSHPAGSYSLESIKKMDENVSYLTIIDPTAFWSLSNYLVIQL